MRRAVPGPWALPLNVARQLVLTGDPIDATEAYRVGLVNELTPPGGALPAALTLADRICANAPQAVRACLTAMADHTGETAGWTGTGTATGTIVDSADRTEGIAAFLEKRPHAGPADGPAR